ncbi:hypothetical protein G6F70_008383 [Rhizopus microsporus]|nr:hypothetical protein G6F71_008388 [Rhizopus microsporus]KAG1195238.1 hypothetical protein G6F70_008383 [Rhizopus microsporus]KAG1208342.1 hypothetical protein G6F69_007303 [Rhizopus microsporus]KAG1227667.1 hypothetical protein G6F67_008307 [Rhizopus microsporus]KAG1259576.1 hypothetical protein G6F68_008016 [Rhizopus microsporus]
MLQEYPTQVQPRSSSTRDTQDQDGDSSNKLDAEAGRILIDLANQDTSLRNSNDKSTSKGDVGTSIKANHILQRLQPDPIMLLAAAAAVIDDEGKYKGRSYERREIKLQTRRHSMSTTKRKSLTTTTESYLYRRTSERRYRNQRPSLTSQPSSDTWMPTRTITPEDEDEEMPLKGESQHTFSWQYLSMKQNPRIKRNAMHAYITYMIYTDMANEQRTKQNHKSNSTNSSNSSSSNSSHHNHHKNVYSKDVTNNNNNNWYMQSYRLPPSPRQRHDAVLAPPTDTPNNNIIGRPLTDFLFDNHRPSSSSILPPPNNARAF